MAEVHDSFAAAQAGLDPALSAARKIRALDAMRVTLGRPPIWLLLFALEALLALAPALLYMEWLRGATAHRYEPGSLFANLSANFRFDHRDELTQLDSSIGRVGALLALAAMLLGAFAAGGWLQVFLERTRGESVQRFFLGGARYFWRFARVLFVTLATLAFVGWVLHDWPWQQIVLRGMFGVPPSDFERLESLSSEATVATLRFVQSGLFALAFGLVMVWGDYTRTRLALHDTSSAVWAGLCTWYTLLRHPVKTLRPMIALLFLEAALVIGLGFFARSVEADLARHQQWVGVAVLLGTGLLVLLWRVVLRGARYHAAVQASREVVRPIARPDPWKQSVGGPGGPRYPIGGDDEFAVAL